MCIWPFLLVRHDIDLVTSRTLLNHERIHARQQQEMLWIFFFIGYILEYLVRLSLYLDHRKAYRSISFEREAFEYEDDPEYLIRRRAFSWFSLSGTRKRSP